MATVVVSKRFAGLDGLRALSVVGVILHHLATSPDFPEWHGLREIVGKGNVGVTVFFVLSGFLITHLLLAEDGKKGRVDLEIFYVRRGLRILPPAVAYLLVVAVLMVAGAVPGGWLNWLRAMFFMRNGELGVDAQTAHYWSLSIEEQFYLLWPAVVVITPRRWRLGVTAALSVVAPLWRYGSGAWLHIPAENPYRIDMRCGGLLMGCLLAMLRERWPVAVGRLGHPVILVAAVTGFVACLFADFGDYVMFGEALECVAIALLVAYVIAGRQTWADRFLNWRPVAWLGTISYSLYLWQQLFCYGFNSTQPWYQSFPMNVILAMVFALASYYLLEQPILLRREEIIRRFKLVKGREIPVGLTRQA